MFTDIEKIPAAIRKELLSDDQFDEQVKSLNTPGGVPTTRKKLDEVDFGIMSPPVAGRAGGRSRRRQWLPWGPSERDASIRLGLKDIPRAHVNGIKTCALILWGCKDYRDVLRHTAEFSGKEVYEPYIIYWTGIFVANLQMLYPHLFDRKRLAYFQSDAFKVLVQALTHKFFDGYTVDKKGNLVRPKGKQLPDPDDAMIGFPTAGAEPTETLLSAKGR
jgi:hypothetical protein